MPLRLGRRRLALGLAALPLGGAVPGAAPEAEVAYLITWNSQGLSEAGAERLLADGAFPGGPWGVWARDPSELLERMAAWRASDPFVDRVMGDLGRWAILTIPL